MNNEDAFNTIPGETDPSQDLDQTKIPPEDNPEKDAENLTADYRTSGVPPANAPASKPPNTRPQSTIDKPANETPQKVGRYAIKKLLGRGGFGEVYLGLDEQLQREVAIKLTFGSRVGRSAVKMFLAEARILAELDHPNIVPVFDIGTTERGDIFIVSKLIDGTDLSTRIEQNRPSRELSLEIIAAIAEALHYAHAKGMIHRDIKPANILLDKTDRPYLADFGIALRETDNVGSREIAGTPAYMSPEQARGEGHLMSNQSDIYSLGVVLYELLSGRRPFRAKSADELLRMVQTTEIRTPRTFDATISRELERVCLKALARRPSDRFAIAKDFADEVRYLISNHLPIDSARKSDSGHGSASPPGSASDRISGSEGVDPRHTPSELPSAGQLDSDLRSGPVRVIPKGLRSFDEKDSEFFLELLPGPFDRTGLPEGLRFWKNRIEATGADESFRVGLVYGPSGCGKSSLMKAGLLPRLSPKIESIYIEATPEDTTGKLLREIQKRISEASGANLADALSIIRRRKLVPSGGKLLLVIDQFEQWLYAHKNYADTELTNALRQCDGVTIQAIVMVRDDFWLSVSRFLRELDIPILERENSALVDLFDLDHAKKVLALFGRAYDKLPEDRTAWTQEQKEFLQQAVEGLSQEEKVISVRLALFAEMMKSKTWAPKTLADLGGIAGVGVTFLEETFGDAHAPIQFRQHQEGVRLLLGALLPAVGTNIKGHSRGLSELQETVGYQGRPREFAELVSLLDKNLRLITPVDESQQTGTENHSYQLTHDYLVPSLREWLTQKQRETKKGRAELKLAERAATWGANQENKQLPTLWEWMQIRRWTDSKRWTPLEQVVMQKAGRGHLKNWGSALLATVLAGGMIGYVFQQQNLRSQQEKITVALNSLQKTLGPAVPVNIEKLVEMKQPILIRSDLASRFTAASKPREKLSLAFALANFGQVEADYLISQIDDIEDRDTANLIDALGHDATGSIEKLRQAASECITVELQRRKARLALAALAIGDTVLPIDASEFEGRLDPGVRTWFIDEFRRWELDRAVLVETMADSTSPALRSAVCLGLGQIPVKQIASDDRNRIAELATKWYSLPDSSTHSAVAWLMRAWEIPEPILADAKQMIDGRNWFVNSQGVTFVRIAPSAREPKTLPDPLEPYRQRVSEIQKMPIEERNKPEVRYELGTKFYGLGQYEAALEECDTVLKTQVDDSTKDLRKNSLKTRLVTLARLKRSEETDVALTEWQATETSPKERIYYESVVLLWLGRKANAVERLEKGLASEESADPETQYTLARTLARFADDDSATTEEKRVWSDRAIGILERWSAGVKSDPSQIQRDLAFLALHSDSRFVKLVADPSRVPEQPYWLASREVTRGEYEAFLNDTGYDGEKPKVAKEMRPDDSVSPTPDHPAQNVSWYDSVMYCNWLSRREGRTPAYRIAGKAKIKDWQGQEIEVDKWEKVEGATGYRLPRELEWEYACRAGSQTDWSTGSDESLLASYCQMNPSKLASPSGKKLPNAWGLHDMHGNVREWCWDLQGSYRAYRGGSWRDNAAFCRSAYRFGFTPVARNDDLGFRVALSPSGIPQSPEADK
jgi:serine/threonine protein kinase/tetratricopeptide (TPR) repeat protein